MKHVFLKQFCGCILILGGIVLPIASNARDRADKPDMPALPNASHLYIQDWDWDEDWDEDWDSSNRRSYDFRYNRVEGLYLGYRINKDYWSNRYPQRPILYGSAGFGFSTKAFQYQIGLEKGFFERYRFAIGGEHHMIVDTPDMWRMPETENTLAALLIKEDFHDYFHREGGSGYISQNFTEDVKFSLGYHFDLLSQLERNATWSLFGRKKRFRENPEMHEGEIHSLIGRFEIDTRNSIKRTTRGWYVEIEGEHAGSNLNGDFNFDRLLVDVRRFQPLGFGESLDFRFRAGTSHGDLPWQKSFHLGGISTLRGFSYKEFPNGPMVVGGNRMVLGQIEYRLGIQDLPEELGIGILDHFHLILFADAGWVHTVDSQTGLFKGFESLTWTDFKCDVGLALSSRSGNVRFQIARRTDTGRDPFVFTFRINRPF